MVSHKVSNFIRWIHLPVLKLFSVDRVTLLILDSSISSKMFSLEVQLGASLIDPVLSQEET